MSPLLRSLVDADNQRPGPSSDDRTRVYATLGVSLGLIPAGAVVAAHAASAASATAATQVTATAVAASSTSTVATAVGAASAVGRLALLIKAPLMTVGVGAVLGAALTAYVVKSPAARSTATAARKAVTAGVLATPRTAPGATAVVPVPTPTAEARAPEERPAAPAEHPVAIRTAPIHHDRVAATSGTPPLAEDELADDAVRAGGALAAEQALLDPARAELARGDGGGALARLELHERRFPSGALAQEREAMTIRALVLTGDRDRARSRASTFRAHYPDSLLWPMIQATLATLATHDATLSARP
jgi:hypothetical protein